ncbi:TPM domain-containing protein [Allopusillimonas ginsengisoli]|uniref:TPM domain-containing protein n=1 Tax=Allopusillimonas ginsengisoli TaxID=453575 RepID=UPI001021B76D|nr:TPM domain-containing protein [Allopusillimonas ginsengisoli]TEA77057.1 hypothetical protein ERE07_17155 [Allopusillimonas ginsengisoli]
MQQGSKWKALTGWATVEGQWLRRKHFSEHALARIAERIRQGELGHTGELMVAIEAASPVHEPDSHLRALEVFGRLGTWDTPLNTGVLLYLALDKHAMHIIADRGVKATDAQWEQVCDRLRERLRRKEFESGLLSAIDDIEAILAHACPEASEGQHNTNDLPDRPVLL